MSREVEKSRSETASRSTRPVTTTAPIVADAIGEARGRGLGPFEYLQSRGYVQDVSDPDGLRQAFADGVVTAYVGFDPTAPSLINSATRSVWA